MPTTDIVTYYQGYHWALHCAACISASGGSPTRAAQLLGAMERLAEDFGFQIWPENQADYDQVMAMLRTGLDDQAFSAAWAAGGALTLEDALDLARRPLADLTP